MNDWLIEGLPLTSSAITTSVGTFTSSSKTFNVGSRRPDS